MLLATGCLGLFLGTDGLGQNTKAGAGALFGVFLLVFGLGWMLLGQLTALARPQPRYVL